MSFKTRFYIHAGAVIVATSLWYTGFLGSRKDHSVHGVPPQVGK